VVDPGSPTAPNNPAGASGTPLPSEGANIPGTPLPRAGPVPPPSRAREGKALPWRRRISMGLRRGGRRVWEFLRANRRSIAVTAGAVALAFLAVVALGLLGLYNLTFVYQHLGEGVQPAEVSLEFTTYTYLIGFCAALGLGLIRAYPPKRVPKPKHVHGKPQRTVRQRFSGLWRWPLYGFATGYVAAIRGTPFLVQMFIVLYAMAFSSPHFSALGLPLWYWAGFFALLINTTGYQAEAIRGGFQSIDPGQIEAAKAMGLSRFQVFRKVTFPQGVRLITLPLANEWISNFKTATILSQISVIEVYYWAHTDIALTLAAPIEAFVMLSIFYVVINVALSRTITYLEKVRRIPGLGTPTVEVSTSQRVLGMRGRKNVTGGRA